MSPIINHEKTSENPMNKSIQKILARIKHLSKMYKFVYFIIIKLLMKTAIADNNVPSSIPLFPYVSQ